MPAWRATDTTQTAAAESPTSEEHARELLARSIAVHGDLRTERRDLAVAYEGTWGRLIRRLQPVLVDYDYRHSSEERLMFGGERIVIAQTHQGPNGVKHVLRNPAEGVTAVWYDDDSSTDADIASASALVADAYVLFILGPSYFGRPGVDLQMAPPTSEDGVPYDRISARLRPGFGDSAEDFATLWIERSSSRLFRVEITLEGTPQTQGATVDVTFSQHRRFGDYLVPTFFYERVRSPVRTFAHSWRLTGFDLDRGIRLTELDGPRFDGAAAASARALEVSDPADGRSNNPISQQANAASSKPGETSETGSRLRSVRGP